MLKHPFRAFMCSTYEDLKNHRAYVIRALRKGGFFVDPMEDWTSDVQEPKQFSQDRLEGCHLCVLLVGFRRGHVPEGEKLSITQLEYKTAIKRGIDVLAFMLKEEAAWPRQFDELDKDPEIRAWRNQLKESKGIGYFGNDPGSIEVEAAIIRWYAKKYRELNDAVETLNRVLQDKKSVYKPKLIGLENYTDLLTSINLLQSMAAEQNQPRS